MARVLLITSADFLADNPVNGNIDTDKILMHIWAAQERHIKPVLGTDLYQKLQSDISGASLAGNYLTLSNLIKPALVKYAMAEFVSVGGFKINNQGVFKPASEAATSADSGEIDDLVNWALSRARGFIMEVERFLDNTSISEYSTNTGADLSPRDAQITDWYLK